MMLTSYGTFRELGAEGLSERRRTTVLQDSAATLLLRP